MEITLYIPRSVAAQYGGFAGNAYQNSGTAELGSDASLEAALQLPTVKAMLDTIAWAEGGVSYQTLFGGGTFTGDQHPNRAVSAGNYTSTAAGRYQFLYRTWAEIKNRLGLPDFSPHNQDIAALDLLRSRGALEYVKQGNLEAALKTLGCAWAALPFATCGQSMRSWVATKAYYDGALRVYGGTPGSSSTAPSGVPEGVGKIAGISIGSLAILAVIGLVIKEALD